MEMEMEMGLKQSILRIGLVVTLVLGSCFLVFAYLSYQLRVELIQKVSSAQDLQAKSSQLKFHVVQVQQWLTDISATRGRDGLNDGLDEAKNHFEQGQKIISQLKGAQLTSTQTRTVNGLIVEFPKFYEVGKKMAQLYIEQGPKGGNPFMAEFDSASENLQQFLAPFVQESNQKFSQALSTANSQARFLTQFALFAIVFFFIGLIFVAFFLLRKLNLTIDQFRSDLSLIAGQIRSTSGELMDLSNELNQTGRNQQDGLNQTVSSMQEISAMLQKTDDNTNLTQVSSQQSAERIEKGRTSIEEMMKSIESILEDNQKINKVVEKNNQELSGVVNLVAEINDKTKVINDIVFQTKLLSFNASVEAARAGEHGKGFAVVASEIGGLADMSGRSSQEISVVLDKSIKTVEELVTNTRQEVGELIQLGELKVKEGLEVAKRCEEVWNEIMSSVQQVTKSVNEIAQASNEQSSGVRAVNQTMDNFEQLTHQNVAAGQSVKEKSQSLVNFSEKLKEINTRFERDFR
jgi:methyl-accepting chemotaxis protein